MELVIVCPPQQIVEEFRELPVPEDVMDLWLYGNAERLLGAPVATPA